MKKINKKIYVKANATDSSVVFSGITFAEFEKYLVKPIDNIMSLSGGSSCISWQTEFERRLELFEGRELVKSLTRENLYALGDFCFVDYGKPSAPQELSEQQIAELLYLGHMIKPLHSPFFEPLENRFAYLAHDDGWYCKLYCRDVSEFLPVLCRKIAAGKKTPFSADAQQGLRQIAENGLLIDLKEDSGPMVKVYTVGEYENMDDVLNDWENIKANAEKTNMLTLCGRKWTLD